jgi:type III pantothenate kinase
MGSDPIIVAIDAGNTRIKWGVHDGRRFLMTGAVMTSQAGTLADAWGDAPAAERAVASNVAGPRVGAALEAACAGRGMRLELVRSRAEQCGVRNGYADPAQLGSDRWASLVAAHAATPGHQLVVNAGTALTVDALTADGRFLGGVIVPGPALMRRSLDHGTAALRLAEGEYQDFPRNTPDAITTGAIQACVGAVRRMAAVMAEQGMEPRRLVLSGGAAAELAPRLPLQVALRENLVLDGLVLIARDA